jgi:hypothetical protein
MPRIQRHGEQNVGRLRCPCLEFVVRRLLPVGVIEIDVEDLVAIELRLMTRADSAFSSNGSRWRVSSK